MQILGRFLAVLFLLPMTSLAQTQSYCQDLARRLTPVMHETFLSSYRPLLCSDNIKKLSDVLKEQNINISSARALHIRHKWAPHFPVIPSAGKTQYKGATYKAPRWAFHAIAIIDGLVLDFDFTEGLRITGVKSYFKEMWNSLETKDYLVQQKPLVDYKGRDLFGVFDESQFPSQAFELTKLELGASPCADYEALTSEDLQSRDRP